MWRRSTLRRCISAACAATTPYRRAPSHIQSVHKRSASFLSQFGGLASHEERDTIAQRPDELEERIISALVVNRPGTLAQIADVFGYADQNISGLSVRSTVVPELSRVTITCRLKESELSGVQKRLRALVCITFFHITTVRSCVENNELLLRSHTLMLVKLSTMETVEALKNLLDEYGAEILSSDDTTVIPNQGRMKMDTNNFITEKTSVFIHIANEPSTIDAFTNALQEHGIKILELQSCGPLFLDTSQFTLDTEMETSFTRRVTQEAEELLMDSVWPTETKPDMHALPKFRIEGLDDEDHDREVARSKQMFAPTSTFQLHANESGHFTAERLKLHARIAHQLYEASPQNVSVPKFVLLIGVPGAGKSTILSHLDTTKQLKLSEFVNFDVDDIISMLPEFYHAMLNIGLRNTAPETSSKLKRRHLPTPQARYQMCREEARFILQKNLHSAIMCRRNIILHGTGKSYTQYASLIDQVKSSGFDVHVVCLDIPLEAAYDRVEKRSNGYGRDVPRLLIDFTASLITRNFRRLAKRVPNAHLFASDVMPPRLVWSKQDDEVVRSDRSDFVQQKYGL